MYMMFQNRRQPALGVSTAEAVWELGEAEEDKGGSWGAGKTVSWYEFWLHWCVHSAKSPVGILLTPVLLCIYSITQ